MAGGSLGGGGDAWAKDHEEIIEHAKGLGYDKVEGVSLPPADAPKETWIAAMDKFNSWKASELAKPESERWWVTRPWSATEGTVRPESGGGGASVARPTASTSPVASNPFYPMLVQEYEAPGLMDYSAYMPADSLFGYEQYQPYTNPNAIDPSIFNYQPPTIYASDPRLAGEGGYIRPTTSFGRMGIGEFGIEDGSSSEAASGAFDADAYIIPGTNTTAQSLFDYEAGDISETIRDQEGNIEPRYYVMPDLRADIVRADIEKARQDAYIQNAAPLVTTVGQIELQPVEVIDRYNRGAASNLIQDQIMADIARVANEIKFRPTSREEAEAGGGLGYGGGQVSSRGVGEHANEFAGLIGGFGGAPAGGTQPGGQPSGGQHRG